ncbi:MAG: aldehyde-activating protein [Alphaproteobacteria bacterium]|nr:hypothetical protein [Rhodospirillales bacterium]MCW9045984.1 aldehyde-activating protein [Alphaproteobacteria bacterium]
MHVHKGSCHCGAIGIELQTTRPPHEQAIGACQCSFCRKHNVRAYSDPSARVTLTAHEPKYLQRYSFGLHTAESVVCRQCGVYVAMVLAKADCAWTTINVDTLDERALFNREPIPSDFSTEDAEGRTARRMARWIPTTLVNWPASTIE